MNEYMTYFALIIFCENSHTIDKFTGRKERILMMKSTVDAEFEINVFYCAVLS